MLAGLAVSLVLGSAAITLSLAVMLWPRRPPPPMPPPMPPPTVDNTAMVAEVLTKAIAETAEAIGKAVQAAQYAPEPPAPRMVKAWTPDADIEAGIVDDSDPTDLEGWLRQDRPVVDEFVDGESPIPGVTLRP